MRSASEVINTILEFARNDYRIRVVGMEGSRTNKNAPQDGYQDYDISFLVTDIESFKESDDWLNTFGERIIMQKPEAMALFPPELGSWFSYLMIFTDGVKLDLTLIPFDELELYIGGDGLLEILMDKDGSLGLTAPSDRAYWIQRPSSAFFDDCCNEFWFASTYVSKGLCRRELLYASHHMETIIRVQLLTMLSWSIGVYKGFGFSVGKHFKYIDKHLSVGQWNLLMKTYHMDSIEHCWQALFAAHELFRDTARYVADRFNYPYPNYDENISRYIAQLKAASNSL